MKRSERVKARTKSLSPSTAMNETAPLYRSDHCGHEAYRVEGDVRVTGEVKTSLPPEITNEYVSSSKETNAREGRRFVVECVTLGFVALVAILNFVQLQMSHSAAQQSKTQFVADQRPYLLVHEISPIHYAVGELMMADLQWANFGKTPAVHEKNISRIFFGRDALALADKFFIDVPDESVPVTTSSEAVIPQSGHGCGIGEKSENSVFDCGFTTSKSKNAVMNAVQLLDATTNDAHLLIVGRIYYRDTAGNRYSTDYCLERFRTGVLAYCPKHNDVN